MPTNGQLEVLPRQPEHLGDWMRYSCDLIRRDNGKISSRQTLWYEIPAAGSYALHKDDAEPYVIATLMQAMQEGRDLIVNGYVSPFLLGNLQEYGGFWNRLLPDTFKQIEILTPAPTTPPPSPAQAPGDAIAAFSGGLDAAFLVWRHHTGMAGHQKKAIQACIMINGFDIDIDEPDVYENAFRNASKTLKSVGLPLLPIRTNFRKTFDVPWDYHHVAALVSCLHFFKSSASTALIGSCASYEDLPIPWGPSPLIDHLLSGDSLRVTHDGAAYSRTEKAHGIRDWKEGLAGLRVCGSLKHKGYNCLRCEKCLRTMANFAVNNLNIPSSLGGNPSALTRRIWLTRLKTSCQLADWSSLAKLASKRGIRPPWIYGISILKFRYKLREIRRAVKTRLLNIFRYRAKP